MEIQTLLPKIGESHRGYCYERTFFNPLEKAFADHWESENQERPGRGCGLLQNLFCGRDQFFREFSHEVTDSERYVAATVVQWLGTNVGFSFLQSVLRDQGLYITDIPKHDPLPTEKEPSGMYKRLFG